MLRIDQTVKFCKIVGKCIGILGFLRMRVFFGKQKVWSFSKVSKVVISGTKVLAKN